MNILRIVDFLEDWKTAVESNSQEIIAIMVKAIRIIDKATYVPLVVRL